MILNCALGDVQVGKDPKHDADHPNSLPFTGILLVLDRPSDQPPHGAEGHRILVTTEAVKRRLSTIVGMGLNYNGPGLDGHDVTKKIGTIQQAWIEGKAVKVKGVIWKKDFPETERLIKGQKLGMSMELARVDIEDPEADVWHLKDFIFTGATVLWPETAAYHKTALAASRDKNFAGAAKALGNIGGNVDKKKKVTKTPEDNGLAAQLVAGMNKVLSGFVTEMKAGFAEQTAAIKAITITASADSKEEVTEENVADDLITLTAEAEDVEVEAGADDEEDSEGDEIEAGFEKKSKDDEGDDEDSEDEDEADEDDVDAGAEGDAPMEAEKDMKSNKQVAASSGKSVKAMQAAAKVIQDIRAQATKDRKTIATLQATAKKQGNTILKMEKQLELHASRVNRVTLPAEANAILAKSGFTPSELIGSGKKFSVAEMDSMIATAAPTLDPTSRMHFKNVFAQAGLLDEGVVNRGFGINQ